MTTDITTRTIGSLLSDPDSVVQRHAHGILKRLRGTAFNIAHRLEYLRKELQAERISQTELHELQTLAPHIEAGDIELLEAAGVPEFPEE